MAKKYKFYTSWNNQYLQRKIVEAMNQTSTIVAESEMGIPSLVHPSRWAHIDIGGEVVNKYNISTTFAIELKSGLSDMKSGHGLNLLRTGYSYLLLNGVFSAYALQECLQHLYDIFGEDEKYIGIIILQTSHNMGSKEVVFNPIIFREATMYIPKLHKPIYAFEDDRISRFFSNQVICIAG